VQKASAGLALSWEVSTGFRRMGRSDRALLNSECGTRNSLPLFPFRIPQSAFRILVARPAHEMEAASWFLHRRSLPPGLASDRRPPFGTAPIAIRFKRFIVFHTSRSAGGMIFPVAGQRNQIHPMILRPNTTSRFGHLPR